MTILHTRIDYDIEEYLLERSQFDNSDIDPIFKSAYIFDEPHMQISPLQATGLQWMISTMNIKNVLEVGTFVGFSTFSMAKVLSENRSSFTTIEKNGDFFKQAERNHWEYLQAVKASNEVAPGAIEKINFVHDDAKTFLNNLTPNEASKIDLFFLDGDKENYMFYLEWAIENMKSGSYFVVDNALFKGGVVKEAGILSGQIRQLTESLKDSNVFNYFFLPVGDCMIVAKKK